MIGYRSKQVRDLARSMGLAGLAGTMVFGCVLISLWLGIVLGESTHTIWEVLLLTFVICLCCGGMLYAGWSVCPEVQAIEDGLRIKSGYVLWYKVPWPQVDTIIIRGAISESRPYGSGATVKLRSGLTFLHTVPIHMRGRRRERIRGFTIMASGSNYEELMAVIQSHLV